MRDFFVPLLIALAVAPLANASFGLETTGFNEDLGYGIVTFSGYNNSFYGGDFVALATGGGLLDTNFLYPGKDAYIDDLLPYIVYPDDEIWLLDTIASFQLAQYKSPIVGLQYLSFTDTSFNYPVDGQLCVWIVAPNTTVTIMDAGLMPLMAVNVTPEPATIGLLAIGGMMLRKRE